MDDLDRKLLALLRRDARAPMVQLAKALGVSRGTVQNRIDRMLSTGRLGGFTIRVARDSEVDRVRALTMIAIEGGRSAAVIRALGGLPEVTAVHTTNGRWGLVAELNTDNLEAFSRTLDAIRMIDGIAASETSLLLATHQF